MGSKEIEAVPKSPARKKYVRSRKKYRKAAWGSLFLQMLLEKLREKELLRAGSASAPQKGEKKAAAKAMQSAGIVSDSRMFRGPFSVMKDYYEGGIQKEALVSSFKDYCGRLIGDGERDEFFRERAQLAITEGYEYYSRANARNAVRQNFKEGRSLVEECGLYIQGMSYYNADYYYLCRNVNGLLKTACAALAEDNSYHNGLSYLLDESCFCHDKESGRGKAMSFLANFQLYHNSGCLELLHTALE